MVTSPTGKGVIIMGGETNNTNFQTNPREIFELTNSMQWTRLEQTLHYENKQSFDAFDNRTVDCPFAIPIPDDLVYEKVQVKNENKRRKL